MYSQIIKEGFLNLKTVPEAKPLTNRGTFHKQLTLMISHFQSHTQLQGLQPALTRNEPIIAFCSVDKTCTGPRPGEASSRLNKTGRASKTSACSAQVMMARMDTDERRRKEAETASAAVADPFGVAAGSPYPYPPQPLPLPLPLGPSLNEAASMGKGRGKSWKSTTVGEKSWRPGWAGLGGGWARLDPALSGGCWRIYDFGFTIWDLGLWIRANPGCL